MFELQLIDKKDEEVVGSVKHLGWVGNVLRFDLLPPSEQGTPLTYEEAGNTAIFLHNVLGDLGYTPQINHVEESRPAGY